MLSTKLRTTQTLDPTAGVAPAAVVAPACQESTDRKPVTARVYPTGADQGSATRPFVSFGTAWSLIGHTSMSKVALRPDRWPLQSTS